ncbi:MAG: aromatic ring-hydroxylating dioxygenase subunit alpha [Gammaproteobacteria bacterium]|nr:aromatic ring-hydroxylating dioxygenase subunit alpha [Gammaproteobacteria bacterium]
MTTQSSALPSQTELPVDADPARAYTLPARYYLDADIYQREKQAIFYRNWHYISHVSALKKVGDYATLKIADENVFVIRSADGELRGFYNICRHRAHELLQGSGNVETIVCPYHAWSYHTDGQLRFARHSDQVKNFNRDEFCLRSVAVEVFCEMVFVNLDPAAQSLSTLVPDLEQDLRQHIPWLDQVRPVETIAFGGFQIEAGWKVVVDNFVECYHCSKAHPAFADMIEMSTYRMDTFGLWSRQLGPDTRAQNNAYDFDANTPARSALFWYLWPTTTINVLPGKPSIVVMSVLPTGLETSSFIGHRYALDDSDDVARMDYLNNILGMEDKGLCESVQRGLKSQSYDQGRFMVDRDRGGTAEHAVHHFHRLVLQALEE